MGTNSSGGGGVGIPSIPHLHSDPHLVQGYVDSVSSWTRAISEQVGHPGARWFPSSPPTSSSVFLVEVGMTDPSLGSAYLYVLTGHVLDHGGEQV